MTAGRGRVKTGGPIRNLDQGGAMAIEDEALEPRRAAWLQPLVLDMMGVAELQAYIAALGAEIARAEAEIARKESHRSAADAFFRRP